MRKRIQIALLVLLLPAVVAGWRAAASADTAAGEPIPATLAFNRDVLPILSDNCFTCHGPDKSRRVSGLRFDTEEGAFSDRGGGRRAIVAGDPGQSEMVRRITAEDPSVRMPPAASGRSLTARQIEIIRRWIEQGARWQKHWSLIPPERPPLPEVKRPEWVRNPIDRFVLVRLEHEDLEPAPEADRATLLRRVTLDLTGLPPTPEEVDAFLADPAPDAYEKRVDRLLASPRFGERLAVVWLDAARYADTNGYQSDGERFMWRWRDWVIDAFNRNLPFDRFTVEQLAGDLLPNPTLDQRIATGFNRNHRGNGEGGIIPEEYAVEYVADRVDTTSTVWLGLTIGCARCHDHKYDPITQREFYQLFAFFNNVPERGKAIKYGNSPPMIKAPTEDEQRALAALDGKVAAAARALERLEPVIARAEARWARARSRATDPDAELFGRDLAARYPLDGAADATVPASGGADTKGQPSGLRFVPGPPPVAAGRVGNAVRLDGTVHGEAGDVGNFNYYDRFSLAAWVAPEPGRGGAILSRMNDAAREEGYSLEITAGKLQLNLSKRWLDDAVRVETEAPLGAGWHHVLATYDGSRAASGIKLYVDGRPAAQRALVDDLNQDFKSTEPLRLGALGGGDRPFCGSLDDVRVYRRVLGPEEAEIVATAETSAGIAGLAAARRTHGQALKLREVFLTTAAPEEVRRARAELDAARLERERLVDTLPTSMVMQEMERPRETHLLVRGAYDRPGPRVDPGVPSCLPAFPAGVPANRLGLARWIASPANPLTARVTVNRFWQMYFGTGLVKTVEDFGSQGERPSHPELLDWLAAEFAGDWDLKRLQRTIVTSAAYRQSSRARPELFTRDPENRLLARGPRLRLPAQMVRDQALFASGLLVEKLGGPSVRPYQPAGLWQDLTGGEDYKAEHGPGLYRRSLYTFWKRTIPPPAMAVFDAPARETCVVRAMRTNTPLQALALMNDVTYVEAARVLAERVLREAGPAPEARLRLAFRLVTARQPSERELAILLDDLRRGAEEYRRDGRAAGAIAKAGERPRDGALDPAEVAAYTVAASLILNLDEAVTKE